MWSFNDPNPWSKIIYRSSDDFAYKFFLTVQVPSLDHLRNWKSIIPNLEFDSRTSELIIPTNDEEGALSVANLVVNNFNGKIDLQEIIDNKLLQISIEKAKKYPQVKIKLKEQIMENLYGEPELHSSEAEFKEDLDQAQGTTSGPMAFGGGEYSYL